MSERKKGVVLSYVQVILSIVINIAYVPILLKMLGKSEYGLYQLVGSLFSYISIFESCMSSATLRNYCDALGKKDEAKANEVLYASIKIIRVLSFCLLFLGGLVILGFRQLYENSLSLSEIQEGTFILFLLLVNMFITLLSSVYNTMIIGNERFLFFKGSTIITQVLQPLLVILLAHKMPYACMVTVAFTFINILNTAIRYKYTKKYITTIEKCDVIDKSVIKGIISLSIAVLFASIADQVFWKADQLILGKMFNTILVAIYSVGSQIYMIYLQFGTQVANVFYPRVSALYAETNGGKKVSDLFVRVGRITLFILLLILSGFIIFGKEFLQLWVGDGYEEAYYVAIVVMIPFTVDLSQNLGLPYLQIVGKYSYRAKMYFFSAILNIFTTILFVYYCGIIGAAVSTGICMAITSGLLMNIYYHRKTDLDIIYYWKSNISIIIAAVLLTVISLICKDISHISFNRISMFCLGVLIYFMAYFITMYTLVMNEDEKNIIHSFIHRRT